MYFVSGSVDYTPLDEVFTFSLPNQQISIEIPIIEDTILEDEEFFLVEFVFLNDTFPVLTAGVQVNVTIIDDDSMSILIACDILYHCISTYSF